MRALCDPRAGAAGHSACEPSATSAQAQTRPKMEEYMAKPAPCPPHPRHVRATPAPVSCDTWDKLMCTSEFQRLLAVFPSTARSCLSLHFRS
eukprot:gene14057-biopygen12611